MIFTTIFLDGSAIDADCDLEGVHVYQTRHVTYAAIMSLVSITENKNSYHRMQLLESDDEKQYCIFQKHGRISTSIGNKVLRKFDCAERAQKQFRTIFKDLTANDFGPCALKKFVKQPDKFQLLDVEMHKEKDVLNSLVPTNLEASLENLMRLICDKKAMKNTMLSFHLDTENMPLGKLSWI